MLIENNFWKDDSVVANAWGFPTTKQNVKHPEIVYWLKPSSPWIKLNSDGTSKRNPRPAGAGGHITNYECALLFTYFKFLDIQTNNYAKLEALVFGLEIYWNKDWRQACVEMDA